MMFLVISIVSSSTTPPESAYWGASISSHAAMSFAFDVMIQFEGQGKGVDFDTVGTPILNYSVSICITMHILNILFYALIAIYLDQVFPNEWGKKKHPLFFLQCGRRSAAKVDRRYSKKDSESLIDRIEAVDGLLKEQEAKNEVVQINGLYKTYPSGK
jgi:ATP-binding cassette subfamily A (ABC1) protein 3